MGLPRWLERIADFFSATESSSKIAKDRLRLVIVHDRTGLNSDTFEKLKEDLIGLISKYAEIDQEHMDISLEKVDSSNIAIVATIPIKSAVKKTAKR